MGKGRILVPIFPVRRKQTNLLLRQNLFDLVDSNSVFIQIQSFVLTSNTWLVITWANNLYAGWDEVTVY